MFEFIEVSLDKVALAINRSGDRALNLSVTLCRNVSPSPHRFDLIDEGARIIAAISDDMLGACQAGDKVWRGGLVGGLPGGECETNGQSDLVDNGVDLRAQSPARETNGVIRAPFFPPAACW